MTTEQADTYTVFARSEDGDMEPRITGELPFCCGYIAGAHARERRLDLKPSDLGIYRRREGGWEEI